MDNSFSTSISSCQSQSSLFCYYQNVRGLCTKTRKFYLSSTEATHLHLIAITETWLHDGLLDSEILDLSMYQVFRKDRNHKLCHVSRGGGVLLAVSQSIKASICDKPICDTIHILQALPFIDLLTVKITWKFRTFFVLVIYIPPQCTSENYCLFFDYLMSLYYLHGSDLIIFGDFNIPDIGQHSPLSSSTYLHNFLGYYDLPA